MMDLHPFRSSIRSPNSFKFDLFGIRPSGAATTAELFDTSLFRVEYIPEPASLVLLALGGMTLAMVKRRGR